MKLLATAALLATAVGCSSADPVSTAPNPGCIHQIYKHALDGWVMTAPVVHFVFWGDYWVGPAGAADVASNLVTWNFLLNTGGVLDRLQEYGVIGSSMINVPVLATPQLLVPKATVINDDLFESELNREITEGLMQLPDDQTIVVVMLPPGVMTQSMIKNGWNGYHMAANYGDHRYAAAFVSYQDAYGTTAVVSHELAEAATNPDTSTGYWAPAGEVADFCESWVDYIGGYDVEKVWSEQACQCR